MHRPLELKDARDMKRLIEQAEGFATLIDRYSDLFAQLYSALLGFEVRFRGPTEKWIVMAGARRAGRPS